MLELVSVIVPIYNNGEYLLECIQSILKQTYKKIEIILVDDGSTDITDKICDEYSMKDERVIAIHKPNQGSVLARKTGIEVAKGKYIIFVDGDDLIDEKMIEKMMKVVEEEPVDLVMCNHFKFDNYKTIKYPEKLIKGYYSREDIEKKIIPIMLYDGHYYNFGVSPALWNKLMKKEMLIKYYKNIDGQIQLGDDAIIIYPYLLEADSMYVIDDFLYYYRQNESGLVQKYNFHYWKNAIALITYMKKISAESQFTIFELQLNMYILAIMCKGILNETRIENKKSIQEKTRKIKETMELEIFSESIKYIPISEVKGSSKLILKCVRCRKISMLVFILTLKKKIDFHLKLLGV